MIKKYNTKNIYTQQIYIYNTVSTNIALNWLNLRIVLLEK